MADKKKVYIYLIQEYDGIAPTHYYKAGRTTHKRQRMQELQTGNPRHLMMICCTVSQVDSRNEGKIHQFFKEGVDGIEWCQDREIGGLEWYHSDRGAAYVKEAFREGLGLKTEDVQVDVHGSH